VGIALVALRIKALIQMGMMATGATTSAATVGAAWTAALGPIMAVVAAMAVGGLLGQGLSELINHVDEPESLKNFHSNPNFQRKSAADTGARPSFLDKTPSPGLPASLSKRGPAPLSW